MHNDRRRDAGKTPKKYLFAGKKGGLKNGEKYTLPHMAEVAGINAKTLHSRLRAKQCKIITDYDLRVAKAAYNNNADKPFETRLESAETIMSQQWLAKALV